jgi:hypothetical protein
MVPRLCGTIHVLSKRDPVQYYRAGLMDRTSAKAAIFLQPAGINATGYPSVIGRIRNTKWCRVSAAPFMFFPNATRFSITGQG